MSHILQLASGNPSVASEVDEYPIDPDFEAELIAQAKTAERATKFKVKAIKRKVRVIGLATGFSVSPAHASCSRDYICPVCDEEVYFEAGEIRREYFSHSRSATRCNIYASRSKSETHRYTKQLLKAHLESPRGRIVIRHSCSRTWKSRPHCYGAGFKSSKILALQSNERVILDYSDPDGEWVADLAVLDSDGNMKYIIEVKTRFATTKRPEPWFEVDAKEIVRQEHEKKDIVLRALRQTRRQICNICERVETPWAARIEIAEGIPIASGKLKTKSMPCRCCGTVMHNTHQWVANIPRQVCKKCFRDDPKSIEAMFA